MAVKNFPNVSPDANATFGLEENTTEFNSVLTKTAQHMTLPGAKWRGSVSFTNRSRQEANKVKAFKASLGGKAGRFYLTPFDAYQNGTMSGTGVIDGAVTSGVSSLPTNGWDANQDTLFEFGDYIEVNGELKMVTDDVSGSDYIEYAGTNSVSSAFDPSAWLGVGDPDVLYTSITEQNPSGESFVGEFEYVGPASMSIFQSNYQSFTAGETAFICFMFKPNPIKYMRLFLQKNVGGTATTEDLTTINGETGDFISGTTDPDEVIVEQLTNGYYLVQVKYTVQDSLPYRGIVYCDSDFFFNPPDVGDKIKMQAAYFGKADDYPAQLLATADIPIAPPLRKALIGGESIITNEPKGKFYLGSNDQSWDINVNGVQSMGFDFIEDVN